MTKGLASINNLFQETDKDNPEFWKYLGVSIDKINEYSKVSLDVNFKNILKRSSVDELNEIENALNIEQNKLKKDEKIKQLSDISEGNKRDFLILNDFLSRKKKSVIKYYSSVSNEFDMKFKHSQIAQLKQLVGKSINHIISLYTLHNWLNKGSGITFSLSDPLSFKQASGLSSENYEHFTSDLKEKSNDKNNYRVFAYTLEDNKKVITILYRQVKDGTIPDFDEPFRNKEVEPIMFEINTEEGTLIIKSKFRKEINWIKEYIEDKFEISLTEVKPELFGKYDSDAVKRAFLEGETLDGNEVEDFTVNKVSFRSSPLLNSPKLSFSLENGDVFPSIKDAYNKDSVDLESIKDIESLSFKSHNIARTIKSRILDDGNVLFSLNDRGIDSKVMEQLENNFMRKFGIPLNKLVTNTKFRAGKADVTDYLMTLSIKEELSGVEDGIFNRLLSDKIILERKETNIYCKNPDCDFTETIQEDRSQCPVCGYLKLEIEELEILDTSIEGIRSYVKELIEKFCDSSEWELRSDSQRTFFGKRYKLINLVNSNTSKSFQILLHHGSASSKLIEKINRTLTPTVIIFVGVFEKHLSKYNNDCIFPINFGSIYNTDDANKTFKQIYELIEHRSKSYLSSVANKSFEILRELPAPEVIGEDYSPTDLENDVFNIIKDIFPNADKWGSDMVGKEVPEGIFTINYNDHGPVDDNKSYVFSYDCKLNTNNKGYDLSKDEQRKAFDYIKMLNEIPYINRYSTRKELSAHIFISNNFNQNNFETMADHFYKQLPDGSNTRPIFIPLDVLIYFHSKYRKNFAVLNNSRNIFMEHVYKALVTDEFVITEGDIDDIMSVSTDGELADFKDTGKVKESVLRKIEKRR